jgi:hypothetical protein
VNTKTNVQLRAATTQRFWLHRANRVAAMGLALIWLTVPLRAADDSGQKCSNATLKGDYGALISGIRGIGPMLTEMFVGTSLRNYDGAGRFTETAANQHGAITGTVVNGQATGTYQVNHDCTGTSTVVLPPPFPTIVSSFVIVDGGREVKEIVMSPAANIVTATLRQK